jgi:hypothetical protein
MSLGVTKITKGDTFALVVVVQIENMPKCFIFVTIEFPEPQDDMVEFDNMMALKWMLGTTNNTAGGFVPDNPVVISL